MTIVRNRTYYLILTALFTALTCVGAFVKMPMGPTPITLQLLFVVLSGVMLGPYYGALAQMLYIAMGLIGIPVFAGGGGPAYVMQPSFGFLLGFIPAAVIAGIAATKTRTLPGLFVWCALGILSCYLIGVPYMYVILKYVMNAGMSFGKVLTIGFLIFIPGDIFKSLAAAWTGTKLLPLRDKIQ